MKHRAWNGLTDRLVAGERLSPDEARSLEEAARIDPAHANELALLDDLAGFVDAGQKEPSADSIAIAHAALARVTAGELGPRPAMERSRSRALGIAGIAAASLVAAALAVLVWWPRDELDATPELQVAGAWVTIASGQVTVDGRAIGDAMPRLDPSATVAVRDGLACLAIEPGIDVCLGAGTTASVEGLGDPEMRVEVRRGHAVARLDPLPSGRSFGLGTARVRAVAVGTIFSIDVSEDGGSVTAAVLDGVVEVRTPDATMRLAAHEVARVHAGGIERDRLTADVEARDLELLASVPDVDGRIGHVAIDVSPPGATVLVDDRTLGTSPLLVALAAGEHRLELRGSGGARVGETLTIRAETVVARRFSLSAAEPPAALEAPLEESIEIEETDEATEGREVARAPALKSSPRALLAEARMLRREDRWRDAASTYRRLLRDHPRSSEAHTALVSLGDLLLDRLGEPAQAARFYLRYVREGAGALAPEARWGIVRARRQQGDTRGEREAIEDFVAHHPDDARAAGLR
jgi:hypothetical protein